MAGEVIAELRHISITFPGVKALDDVDLVLRAGEVHALMGENGAGKSTLIKALTGVYRIDEGSITVAGAERVFSSTADAQAAGIATVYQEVNLCANLTVGENIMLGREARGTFGINWRATHAAAAEAMARLGLTIDPRSQLSSHSLAVQQLVAIARATVLDSSVLVLDEPTSSLDRSEVQQLFAIVRRLRDAGTAVLFVTHFLEQVYEISDRITVLRNGRLVGEYRTAELPRWDLVSRMLGHELSQLEAIGARASEVGDAESGTPVLTAEGLYKKGSVGPSDLVLYPGEIVGLAGLLGSGRTELARLIYGADRADAGRTLVKDSPRRLTTPRAALGNRIAFSSEDRRSEGIIGDLSVRQNLVLAVQAKRGWARPLSRAQQDELVGRYVAAMGVHPADPEVPIKNLSGGNQQKVLLGRWLATDPELIILDEPTRGIDVGAKAEIQKAITDLAATGVAVLFISSELEEVVRVSHRIYVLRDRRVIAEVVNGEDTTVSDIVNLIAGDADRAETSAA
ncbi:sugar ABC transporter ATP-binding protein [Gryllotalpicola daejeonensis]|uniref:Sugar ABC transporter ATP-binding protein n=1 Tax=Gryllotalpicola daejeonensis TaxID=993087 RepID=A0ABP7ZNY0_9MICO